jgi:hypothetical protein
MEGTGEVELVPVEVLPAPTMPWKCLSCRAVFDGPRNRPPPEGCAVCGSREVIDVNVSPLPEGPLLRNCLQAAGKTLRCPP